MNAAPETSLGVAFSGPIDPEMREELRALYFWRKPLFPVLYALMAFIVLGIGAHGGARTSLLDWASFGFIAAFLLVYAFWLPHLAWRFWWPTFEKEIAPTLCGRVAPEGLYLDAEEHLFPWSSFLSAKHNASCVLLYLTKSEAIPLHRRMVSSEEAWQAVLQWVAEGTGHRQPVGR